MYVCMCGADFEHITFSYGRMPMGTPVSIDDDHTRAKHAKRSAAFKVSMVPTKGIGYTITLAVNRMTEVVIGYRVHQIGDKLGATVVDLMALTCFKGK